MAIDLEEAKKLLSGKPKSSNGGDSDIRWYKFPDDGSRKIRFLPPLGDSKLPGKIVWKHWNLPDGSDASTCLKTYNLKECPVCAVVDKFRAKLTVDDWESSPRSYLNVLILDDPQTDPTLVNILGGGEYNYYWLLEQFINVDVGDITDPKVGHDVTMKRKKFKGALERQISLKTRPLADSDEDTQKILDSLYDFEKIWKSPDDEYVMKLKNASELLEAKISDRLLTLAEGGSPNSTDDGKVSTETKAETSASGSSNSSSKSSPPGAPDCFSKEHNTSNKKCVACAFEFNCLEAAKG